MRITLVNTDMKNECNVVRDLEEPYEVWRSKDGEWEWRVLKKYQKPENEAKNALARWFVAVRSPFTWGHWEYGDEYVSEIKKHATKIK